MPYEKHRHRLLMQYPAIDDLERKAAKRMPHVGWEYLQSGTGREELVRKNLDDFNKVTLTPQFCKGQLVPETATTLFGQSFSAPFGIAPVGLTGLMWPRAEIIMAKTANKYQIPFCLSTAATETPETVGPHVGNMGWFQLYPPRERALRTKLLDRARDAGFHTLVITADVPMPSRRERTKRAGIRTPPKITPRFIWQGITHPAWTIGTLQNGLPRLRTMEAYSELRTMMSVERYVRDQLGGNLSWEHCREMRDEWDGPVILKGILHPEDALRAVAIGLDGIVVSNHGGRQFDGAPTSISVLPEIVRAVQGKTAILFDSGIRSGLDILRALRLGADFVLLGRAFLYGVAALGNYGADHVVEILKGDLENNMVQLGISTL
ncbi:MAG: alpha-hydroxy acid oxidase [Saprospiraceae bacterium]|nr:alpha-hydroxy-acid oxidizing protein [Lewinella sp.]